MVSPEFISISSYRENKATAMNLLPKTSEEFATKEYWNKFFQKRGKSAFDW